VATNERSDLEPHISVGCAVSFQPDVMTKEGPRYQTVIRGWSKPAHILIDRPKLGGRFVAMHERQVCVVRFVREGKAYAFDSVVLEWDSRQTDAYCRIAWPKAFQVVPFRKFERARMQLPCRAEAGADSCNAQIVDMSIGGCRLQTPQPIQIGTALSLNFTLPDGSLMNGVRCTVRNARETAEQAYLGCEFDPGQICVESHIAFFLAMMLDRTGVRNTRASEVLLIDDDLAQAPELRKAFQAQGLAMLAFGNMMDGLMRLRAVLPRAVLLNENQKQLPGVAAARLIHLTPGLESIPIYLYKTKGREVAEEARSAGIQRSFADDEPTSDVANQISADIK
jgi:c-di-GMP-binding flagellar brake protein YcgR